MFTILNNNSFFTAICFHLNEYVNNALNLFDAKQFMMPQIFFVTPPQNIDEIDDCNKVLWFQKVWPMCYKFRGIIGPLVTRYMKP